MLGPGEMFGELSLFDPGPRTATATVVADTTLLELGHQDLVAWLDAQPTVAQHLLQALARRLRRTNEALADLVFSDVPGRVAKALLDLSTRFGDAGRRGHPRGPRPHAGGAGPAGRRLPRDGQQGLGRLRRARLGPPGGRAVVLLDVDRLERRAR